MFEKIFPSYFCDYLKKCPVDKICEIRIRHNKKITITISNKTYYLSQEGLTGDYTKSISADRNLIEEIIRRACDCSVYAFESQIKYGFITTQGGIRIGLGGEGVYEKNYLKTLKNINSLAIRFPHEVEGCSKKIIKYLFQDGFLNTLIISPPGGGKTTLIRDIILQMSIRDYCYNVLVVDERGEIANSFDGNCNLNIGNFCDVLSNTTKDYAFECGIRSLRPDIIATDELSGVKDYEAVNYAKACGVTILASIHAKNIEQLKQKKDFDVLLKNKTFDRYVVLSMIDGPGTIEAIYDENLRLITSFR